MSSKYLDYLEFFIKDEVYSIEIAETIKNIIAAILKDLKDLQRLSQKSKVEYVRQPIKQEFVFYTNLVAKFIVK